MLVENATTRVLNGVPIARFYPTFAHPVSSATIAPPSSSADGKVIDSLAALASPSARAARAPEGESVSLPSKLSETRDNTLWKRKTQAPRVMGKFDHPVPPMPPVRFPRALYTRNQS